MNFLILINGAPKYKYFYAEIAKKLEKEGHGVYFAVIAHHSDILEPLEYIDSSKNSFFFDDYLEENFKNLSTKEIDLDETWGDIFYSDFDRSFFNNYSLKYSDKYWTAVINGLESFFKKIIINNNINVILYENVSNSFAYMAYKASTNLGCTYIGLIGSRLPNRYEIQTSIYSEPKHIASNIEKYELTDNEKEWYKSYQEYFFETQPDYMKDNIINKKKNVSDFFSYRKIITAKKRLKVIFKTNTYYAYQSGHYTKKFFSMYKLNWTKVKNEKQSKKYYLSIKDVDKLIGDGNESFYIYPTHYHPESSTSVLAPDYTNEINNIINIHNNLPVGSYLYVKDHISARGVQDKSFYNKISSLPGVRLIHFDYNIKKLIRASQGVIAITSTAGYEAVIMNKPVYLFGRVFYEDFPNVYKLNSFLELRDIQRNSLQLSSPEEIRKFVIAYYRYSFEGKLLINNPELWSEDYFSTITNNIFKKIKSVHNK